MPEEENELLNDNYIVQIREVKEADGSFTKKVYLGRQNENGTVGDAPDEAILVQQQATAGANAPLIEGIAECFFRLYGEDEIERNSPAPRPQEEPDLPTIIAASNTPSGPLPSGKIIV